VASIDSNRGAKRAREARAALGLDPLEPLPCLLTIVEQQVGMPVAIARLPDDVAGACWRRGDAVVLWVNGTQGLPRRRFTLAHELGHAWCRHDGALEVDSFETLSGKTSDPLEVQANAFAAEVLLPKAAVEALFDVGHHPGLDEVVVLAGSYGVSAIAALIRLEASGLVSKLKGQRIRGEIDRGVHLQRSQELDIEWLEDRLATMQTLPYFSPSLDGSALTAALTGRATVGAAAHAAGVPAAALAPGLEAISR
jgi:Zn-dependent peptidase ImmA (M78 family)